MLFIIRVLIFLLPFHILGQFQVNGDAQDLGNNSFQLTPAVNWMSGSVWYQLRHNLDSNFNLSGQLFFGNDDAGADGIVFVMQDRCLGSGTEGGGLGYQNMPGNSIGVEFDTYRNGPGGNFDPEFDHLALHQSGNVNHSQANNLAGPFQMHATKADVEDSLWYDFQINYSSTNNLLEVYFDGSLRLAHTIDLKNDIFNGNPFIYWGFTSATGGLNAVQSVSISDNTSFSLRDDTICGGSTTVLLPPIIPYNLAFNSSVSASSINNGSIGQYDAINACDMDMNTQWSSVRNDNEWLLVDLGRTIDIDSVLIYWNVHAIEYKIQVSADSLTWTDLFHETNGDGGLDRIIASAPGTRYIKMQGISRSSTAGYSIWEFEIFGLEQYAWSPNDGTIDDTTSNNPTFTPTSTTSYTLTIPDMCAGYVEYTYNVVIDCILLNKQNIELSGASKNGYNILFIQNWPDNTFTVTLERSEDGIHWQSIQEFLLKEDQYLNRNIIYEDHDIKDKIQGYYYRIKSGNLQEEQAISSPIFIEQDLSNSGFKIFPNPVNEHLYIHGNITDLSSIKLVDISGRLQKVNIIASNSDLIELDIKGIRAGLYFLFIDQKSVRKILKR